MALDGKRISELARVTAVGDSDLLALDKGGTEANSIYVSDLLGNSAAKNKVTKTGDTMTGNLTLDNSSLVLKGTNDNIYYVNYNGNPGYKKSAGQTHSLTAPVGSLIMGPIVTTPVGYILCDGQDVSRTDYSDLFAVIGTNFGAGDGSTTFNVPDYRGCFLRGLGGASGTLYAKQEQGLPNITGEFIPWSGKNTYDLGGFFGASTGAIRVIPGSRTKVFNETAASGTGTAYATFDASISNSIYGASENVTPENYAVQYFIKY